MRTDSLTSDISPVPTSVETVLPDSSYSDNARSESKEGKRPKKIACTECRQQKAKCDAHLHAPNPCSRCQKRNIPCRLVSDFKRTFKRAKMAQMVKDYENIKYKMSGVIHPKHLNDQELLLDSLGSPNAAASLPPIANLSKNTGVNYNGNGPNTPLLPNPNILIPNNVGGINATNNTSSTSNYVTFMGGNSSSNSPPLMANNSLTPSQNESINKVTPVHSGIIRNNSFYSSSRSAMNNLITAAGANNNSNEYTFQNYTSVPHSQTQPQVVSSNLGHINSPSVYRTSENLLYPPEPIPKPVLTAEMLECQGKALGDFSLSKEQVTALFKIFALYYHPFLPVVDISKGVERLYRLSPVLFWTIMFISLRRHHSFDPCITKNDQQALYFKLSPILKSVLAEITISPITRYAPTEVEEPILNVSSVYSVQAFLLYTFWPPLISSLSADSSWNTIGIAFYQAIRMGLHSPGHNSDGLESNNKNLLKEQIRTWIACNVVSQTIATAFGFPGFVQSHASLLMICREESGFDIPFQLRQMLEIQLFEDQVARTLNNNIFDSSLLADASEKLPLIQLLSDELDQLEMRLCSERLSHMDDFRKLALLAARVHLFSYHFLDTTRISKYELRRGIVKVYNASISYLAHCRSANKRDPNFIANLPSVYNLMVWQTSVIIVRLIHSPYKDILDLGAGKDQYESAMRMTFRASIMKHDIAYRSSGIMKSTWAVFKAMDKESSEWPKVKVKSRMAVSVFFDSLIILREKCGMVQLRPKETDDEDSDDYNVVGVDDDEYAERDVEKNEVSGDHEPKGTIGNETDKTIVEHENRSDSTASKKRSNYQPEYAARKIISTIPLDPQPIALSVSPSGSSPSSKSTSPHFNNNNINNNALKSPVMSDNRMNKSTGSRIGRSPLSIQQPSKVKNLKADEMKLDAPGSPPLGIDSWEMMNEFDSEGLFKDLDAVINDFGLHSGF